jgi:hypothetical protein
MDDSDGYAQLWLSELGAHVPEERAGAALAPRERGFGLDLEPAERARRNGARLVAEGRTAARASRA